MKKIIFITLLFNISIVGSPKNRPTFKNTFLQLNQNFRVENSDLKSLENDLIVLEQKLSNLQKYNKNE